ncbi:hypothetical protein ES703_13727 [subsurface metagenome]|nr:MAG: hypothetical protein CEE41_04875 [Hadesarchaea archaeon B3_Hades]
MTLEAKLIEEIKKWTSKLDGALSAARARSEQGEKMFSNIKAYRGDSEHFLKQGDLIKSFECLIWAWSLLEICKELKHLE